jgi:hypothetical protein
VVPEFCLRVLRVDLPVEKHFEAAVRDVNQLEAARRAAKPRKPPASTRKKP